MDLKERALNESIAEMLSATESESHRTSDSFSVNKGVSQDLKAVPKISRCAWDYLIITASHELQAKALREELSLRHRLGVLDDVAEVLVVPDPNGRQLGTGGSTVHCLAEILKKELLRNPSALADSEAWHQVLSRLRILILHAGGESRRLPAYGPLGRLFMPLPGSDGMLNTLFDRQIHRYLSLPANPRGSGQVVIAAGDVLVEFDPREVRLSGEGITSLGVSAPVEECSRHGVYCTQPGGVVTRFLQKPDARQQREAGAVDEHDRSIIDVGIMSFDASTAVVMLDLFWRGREAGQASRQCRSTPAPFEPRKLDFYREIACALGTKTTAEEYLHSVHRAGSAMSREESQFAFQALNALPFHVHVLRDCEFLHFGSTRQLISGGKRLLQQSSALTTRRGVVVDCCGADAATWADAEAWTEGCRLEAKLDLGGSNVLVGLDVEKPLSLPRGACVDVTAGRDSEGKSTFFVRCYGIDDDFDVADDTYCGRPLAEWLAAIDVAPEHVWDADVPPADRTVRNARLIPAEGSADSFHKWLWVFDPAAAEQQDIDAWIAADRYSLSRMTRLVDATAYRHRRLRLKSLEMSHSPARLLSCENRPSALELAALIEYSPDPSRLIANYLAKLQQYDHPENSGSLRSLVVPQGVHGLGSALLAWAPDDKMPISRLLPKADAYLSADVHRWLVSLGFPAFATATVGEWAGHARATAFEYFGRTMMTGSGAHKVAAVSTLRSDEIVWGRAPARLDLAGGWTDTPPYTLEFGGTVLNAAVDLNGQPPIQAFARVIDDPLLRIASIDSGTRIEVSKTKDLLDFREVRSEFGLAKAAIVLCGMQAGIGSVEEHDSLQPVFDRFGGGLELTTLAAIPRGSGLGTSSIMGAVLLSVLSRVNGQSLQPRQLYHAVLQLEQLLTTGGGWQDQIGGVVDGVKLVTTHAGMMPDPEIQFISADVLDPALNGGQTLLYYTGITRLAKNILAQVVGRYLDRQCGAMSTLQRIRDLASETAMAMGKRDLEHFGRCVGRAWELNKRLDPGSTNSDVEEILRRVGRHIHGAKLLGAGGGGFLLLVARSPEHAVRLRETLEADPPNPLARFFAFSVNQQGLRVTAS